MPPRVILLVGCSGSGKSTYVRQHFPKAAVVSADDYFEALAKRRHSTYPEVFDAWQLGAAHQECRRRFQKALAGRRRVVVVDNTNALPKSRNPYLKDAAAAGSRVEIHVLGPRAHGQPPPGPKAVKAYLDACHARNAHGVPREVIEKQFRDMEDWPSGIYLPGKPPLYQGPLLTQG